MFRELSPTDLTWDEANPARHPFDSASATQVVYSLEPARHVPSRPDIATITDPDLRIRAMNQWESDEGDPWVRAMSYALAEHYGRWALGWRWGQGESDVDGGVVKSWFSAQSSIRTPENTPVAVVVALREWREWLESLAGWFDEYPLGPGAAADQRAVWRHAARDLIMHVVDATECGSAWYGHCARVLSWFLERWGVAADVAQDLVNQAIGERFESWTAPDSVVVDDVAERLALSVPPQGIAPSGGAVPDHLQRWLEVRAEVPWLEARRNAEVRATPSGDDTAVYIRGFDGAIDPARAEGLLAALELMRADAARGAALDFELLRDWQQHVLGVSRPAFRTLPAFAKGGRERYGIAPGTRDRLDACLAESAPDAGHSLPVAARAARAFLDVCFFHPFDDGNARSAFLALLFMLARERFVLYDGGRLIRGVTFYADDPQDALWVASYIGTSIAST